MRERMLRRMPRQVRWNLKIKKSVRGGQAANRLTRQDINN